MKKREKPDTSADRPLNDSESEKETQTEQPDQSDNTTEQKNEEASAETIDHSAGNTDDGKKSETEQDDESTMLKKKLEENETALTELSDKYMRLAAEYDNFRRRSQREKVATYTDSAADVVKQWLPILDNLDRAEFISGQYEHEDARKVCEGIQMIQKQVNEVLTSLGVEEIDCAGQPFDPELHDAVMHVEDDQYDVSTVVEVLRKGYRLKDRVIRHVMVKVAN